MLCGCCPRSLYTRTVRPVHGSRRSGRLRTENRTLAGQPVSCSTVVPPDHRTGDRAPSAGACSRPSGVCAALAALALPLAAPERPSFRNVGRTSDVQPSGVKASGWRALRRGSEAGHRGDTQRPFDMGARHNDEHQPPPCHRRRPHRDARPGWDGVARVRGPCKGRARRRRLAGCNRGRRLDRPARGHSSSCGRFGTWSTPRSSRATRASSPASARSSARTGTDGGAARRRGLGRFSCQMFNAALRSLCVRSRCAGASFDRCSCHDS